MNIADWYRRTIGTDSHNAVAARAGVNQSTITRQLRDGRLGYDLIVPIARAYGADPIEGLIVAGLITQDDIDMHTPRATLVEATDKEIADEVWRRLVEGQEHPVFDKPMSGPAPEVSAGASAPAVPIGSGRRVVSLPPGVAEEAAAQHVDDDVEAEMWEREDTP